MPVTMPPEWQEINEHCHCCHSWRDLKESSISAMSLLILIFAVFILTAVGWAIAAWVGDDPLHARPTRRDWFE